MAYALNTPEVDQLDEVVRVLGGWQDHGLSLQLHPGDVGWFWQYGPERTAASLRTWRRDGEVVAVGLLDGPDVLRMTMLPTLRDDDELAWQIVADVSDPDCGVLPAGAASVESPDGTRVQELLTDRWELGQPWSPLRRDLAEPVEPTSLRVEVIESGHEADFVAVHQSAWGSPRFTSELWHAMAAGAPFADGRCLLGYDEQGVPVAGITVWSAGVGKPGLIEPMGVHADHRGRGHGAAICIEAAAELARMGSSCAEVCTTSANVGAVATYRAAGYRPLPERLDRTRAA